MARGFLFRQGIISGGLIPVACLITGQPREEEDRHYPLTIEPMRK